MPPPRDSGRFRVALRERDGDYEPGRVLQTSAVPGEEVVLIARVNNQTRVVDNFDLSIDGLPAKWSSSVRPETVYLTPRDAGRGVYEQEVEVRITPPRTSDAPVGEHAISVVAASRATGARETADLNLSVEPFAKLTASLRPAELRSRYRARGRLVVKNEGNAPADVKLTGVDPTDKLRFKFTPDELQVSDEDEARVEVRAPRRTWIGQPKMHQFTVEAKATTGEAAVSQEGRLDHRPYLRPWVLLLVPLITAAVAWYLQRPEQGTVPVVTKVSLREAAQRVTQAGLRPEFEALPPEDRSNPAPRVIRQDPAPEEKVDVGTPVTIFFEQGIGSKAVPGVVGMTVRQARAALEPYFQLGQVLPLKAPRDATIQAQKPEEGDLLGRHMPVSVTLDRAEKITAGTVAGGGAAASKTPAQDGNAQLSEPLAYSDGHQIFVKEPEAGANAIAGDDKSVNIDPTWNPADRTIAYVHKVSETTTQIRSVKPQGSGSTAVTGRDKFYVDPAYSPTGALLAMIEVEDPDFGGRLCLMATDGGKPTCREDEDFYYYRPAWGGESTLYVLRREKDSGQASGWTQIARFTAEEPAGSAPDEWAADTKPVVSADVQSVAIGTDGKIAALTRKSADDAYSITLYGDDGSEKSRQLPSSELCEVSWSGADLVAMVDGCSGPGPPPKIHMFDPDDLEAAGKLVVRKGQDPALAPAG